MNIQKLTTFLKYPVIVGVGAYFCLNYSFFLPFSGSYPPAAPFKVISYKNGVPDSVEAAAGVQYRKSGVGEFFLGKHYRFLWTTPVKVKVLNLQAEGMRLTKRGGGMQTTSFTITDKNGQTYSLRSLDKDPISVIPQILWRTVLGSFIRDQVSATDPYALKPVLSLAEKAGIAQAEGRLVFVLPNDPAFRNFNLKKSLLFYLTPKYSTPIDSEKSEIQHLNFYSTEGMLKALERNPGNRIDTMQFLRCRLFDLYIGDWDRHAGQWDWVGFQARNDTVFQPIPKDRDQAFGNYEDGVFPFLLTRNFLVRKITSLTAEYEDIEGFSQNGSQLDERFLKAIPYEKFKPVIADLQARLNDEALANAIRQYPKPIYPFVSEQLLSTLKARREGLPQAAKIYGEVLKNRK